MRKLMPRSYRLLKNNQKHEYDKLEVMSEEGGENEPVKRAVIVHCWGGEPEYAWYPWVAKQLEAKGVKVDVPEMPDTEDPQLSKWLSHLKEVIGEPDEELVLIGHSLGCAAVLRYLESLPKDSQVGKVILVAAFTDQIGHREFDSFFKKPFNFEKIKTKSVTGFYVFQSNDDPYVTEQYGIRLEEDLGAELFIKNAAGHMSGPLDEKESCKELPEVVEEALGAPIQSGRRRFTRTLRKTLIGSFVLVLLFGGAGFAYTYYMDKHSKVSSLQSAVNAAAQQEDRAISPSKASTKTPESAAINLLTSPIARGQTAMETAQTLGGSTCTIAVTYYGGAVAHDPGLVQKTADAYGTVSWNWTISPTAPIGYGMTKVNCTDSTQAYKTAMVEGTLQVTAH